MPKTIKITYRPANVRGLGPTCQLTPGKNEIPLEVWETYKDAPAIAQLLADEEIVVHDAAPVAKRGRKSKASETETEPEPATEGDEPDTIGSDEA